MANYGNFDLGNLDKMWGSDKRFLQSFIDSSALLQTNYRFCFENFAIDGRTIPVDKNGVGSFTVETKALEPDGMAEFKAAMAKNTGIDQIGSAGYSGSIVNFGKALNPVTITDREELARKIEIFGSEKQIVKDYIESLQTIKNYMDARLSNMAGQLISTGKILGRNKDGNGLMYHQDALVPSANRVNGGTKAWTEPTCNLLDQMQDIEKAYRDRTGDGQSLKWQIPLNMWRNIFLKNEGILTKVKEYRTIRELPTSSGGTILEDWIKEYINALGITSPIEIVKEGEVEIGLDTRKAVKGWDDKIAVLRPVGEAGLIIHGEILKATLSQKYASRTVARNVAYMERGLYALINSEYDIDGYP
ncbi:MAG: hypothetical protein ACRCX5_11460, partial [Bacteroidales bacterium]